MNFNDLIGNNKIKKSLQESVINNNVLHCYLFSGIDGIGKKIFARNFAKLILCENIANENPCNECKSCKSFDNYNNPDYFEIQPDGNSIKIDQIRQMIKQITEKPIESSRKVFVVDNADVMTVEAQNCLLKTLEEPQSYAVIILIASNEENLLATVKSRCTKIRFNSIENSDIKEFIKKNYDNIDFDNDLCSLCGGSLGFAIKIIEKIDILKETELLVNELKNKNEAELFMQTNFFSNNKDDINLILDYIYMILFGNLKKSSYSYERDMYIKLMNIVSKAKLKLKNVCNYDMTIDYLLINLWEVMNEKNNWC